MPVLVTPDERCERVRMALAEAGYPDAEVSYLNSSDQVKVSLSVPHAVAWRAWAVTGETRMCWPCWIGRKTLADCDHDPQTSPWPELPEVVR